ncbi:DUF475 domain-containing protein [Puniceibacterium sp. IMCC21224]|uniref:DUF475 domain-containing protein n=1 Tax=Puniceibacterium sp. IMCC21224 TaxID=1618204 RepID=UPI00064E14AE|nr:DUF475 domain-containing protein [Puniceibacterium sp. IMCC21224]KMK69067.1 hypothetical protein IMCC21224_113955 [Puniceibacterium sp. IMCC21224]
MSTFRYFRGAFLVTLGGLFLALLLGWSFSGTISGAIGFFLIGAILTILEISLSFDNAIVNANKLKEMSPLWQRRFLTWGILIAVFGMRIVFPLLIVVIAAGIGPIEALVLAARKPAEYAMIIGDAHLTIAAFGAAFLMMVSLRYFVDEAKDIDWIAPAEVVMRRCGSVRGFEIAIVLIPALMISVALPENDSASFMFSAICGLVTFLLVDMLGLVLDTADSSGTIGRGALGAFLYLEVLDASFSFDGVIGAFALTQNLFLIAIGLGIGAMYVRSMTVMLVEKKTLTEFRYLEHGAFWSILVLSLIIFAQTLWHVPELLIGSIGTTIIGLSLASSVRHGRV